jgi:hypothetical protein
MAIDKSQAATSYQYHSSLNLNLNLKNFTTILRNPSGFCDGPLWRKKIS